MDSAIASGVILLIGAWIGIFGWQLWLFALVSTNANFAESFPQAIQ